MTHSAHKNVCRDGSGAMWRITNDHCLKFASLPLEQSEPQSGHESRIVTKNHNSLKSPAIRLWLYTYYIEEGQLEI